MVLRLAKNKLFLCIGLWVMLLNTSTFAQTFVVTKTTDPDPFATYNWDDQLCSQEMYGTLRWAVLKTNDVHNTATRSTIAFNIADVTIPIRLKAWLPFITKSVIIDGTTQPGYQVNNPVVHIEPEIPFNQDQCIPINGANNCIIKGLYISKFSFGINANNCINIEISGNTINQSRNLVNPNNATIDIVLNNVTGGIVKGNILGTDITKSPALASMHYGIDLSGSNIVIGGTGTNEPNIIAFHDLRGIWVSGGAHNKISRNLIYSNPTAIRLLGGNTGRTNPATTSYVGTTLSGTAVAGDIIEIFGGTGAQDANKYLQTVTTAANGTWTADLGTESWMYFNITATDNVTAPTIPNTSELVSFANQKAAIQVTNNSPLCVNQGTLVLTANLPDAASYAWTGPNGFTSTQQNPFIANPTLAAAGVYTVKITLNSGAVFTGQTSVSILTATAPPISSNSPVCAGTTLTLSAPSVPNATYSWTGPNGFTSSQQNPFIQNTTTAMSGTYSLTLTVAGGCTFPVSSTAVAVTGGPADPHTITVTPVDCKTFTLSYSGTAIPTSQWNFGDGTFSPANGQNPITHTYPASGTYTITLSGAGISPCLIATTVTVTDFVNSDFICKVNSPCDVSEGVNLTINNFNTTYSYVWNINGVLQKVSIDGRYTAGLKKGGNIIKLTTTNPAGCYSDVSKVINIGVPDAEYTVSSSVCLGDLLTVTNVNSGGDLYTWTVTKPNGTSTTSTGMNLYYSFPSAGVYTVALKIENYYTDANGTPVTCSTPVPPVAKTITVSETPKALFTLATGTSGCKGSIALVLPVNTMTSYTLDYGDGTAPLTGTSAYAANTEKHTYSTNGVFKITLTITNNGCTRSYNRNVTISNNVIAVINASSYSICKDGSAILKAELSEIPAGATNIQYAWTGPNSFVASGPQITVSTAGTYTVLITSDGTCPVNVTLSKTIIQLAYPTAGIQSVNQIDCANQAGSVILTIAEDLAKQGYWINNTFTAANPSAVGDQTITVNNLIAGDNYITIANGMDKTCSTILPVHIDKATIELNFTSSQASCSGTGSASVNPVPQATTIKWYAINDYPTTSRTNNGNSLDPGSYVVEVVVNGCKETKYFDILAPSIGLSLENNNLATCAGKKVHAVINVQSTLSGFSFVWKKKDNNGVFQNITGGTNENDLEPGSYHVIASSGSCSTAIDFIVNEFDPITVTLNVEDLTCKTTGNVIALTSGGDGNYKYIWNLDASPKPVTTNPVLPLPVLTGPASTPVFVGVTDGSGCSATSATFQIQPVIPVTFDDCGGTDVGGTSNSTAINIQNCYIGACVKGGTAPYNFEWYRIGEKTRTVEHFFKRVFNNSTNTYDLKLIKEDGTLVTIIPPPNLTTTYPERNEDNDPSTVYYPYWQLDGGVVLPKLQTTGIPYSVIEKITDEAAEIFVTSNSGPSGALTSNEKFKSGTYKIYVTDAKGCRYGQDLVIINLVEPTDFAITFDFAFGLNKQVIPDEIPELKVDPVLADNMQDAARELKEAADKCLEDNTKNLATKLKRDCFNLDHFEDKFSVSYDITEHHYTLYYYDRAGRLTKTVPPEGVELLTPAQIGQVKAYRKNVNLGAAIEPAHRMTTQYQYNSLTQLINQNTPDGGVSRFLYDEKSRLRFSQNAKQQLESTYSYTKYDDLGRIVETGESSQTGLNFNDAAASLGNANNKNFPSSDNKQIMHTVYSDAAGAITYYGKPQRYLQNRISYKYMDEDPTKSNDEYYTYYSYDAHGNIEWLVQVDPNFGKSYIAYEYDLISGKALKVKYNENTADRFFHRYTYDSENKLTKVETSCNGELWDTDASYDYYANTELKRSVIGEDHLQGVDYIYTISGWLKSINTPHLDASDDPGADIGKPVDIIANTPWQTDKTAIDRFGMILNYYKGDYTRTGSFLTNGSMANANTHINENALFDQANNNSNGAAIAPDLYNGNISSWVHSELQSISKQPTLHARADLFKYDLLNRIRQSVNLEQNGTAWNPISGATIDPAKAYKTDYTYDANGNILFLNRYDETGAQMDNLSYTYDQSAGQTALNKNQLMAVTEGLGVNSMEGRADIEGTHNYTYNAIGNLVHDESQERLNLGSGYNLYMVNSDITWTIYGKIKKIEKNIDPSGLHRKESITYSYDASGNRIRKEVWKDAGGYNGTVDDAETVTTFYVREAQGNVLSVYTKGFDNIASKYKLKLIEQPLYGSDRLGINVQEIVLSEASTLIDLTPPDDGTTIISEYQNWITTTNKTELLPGGTDQLCECSIKSLSHDDLVSGENYKKISTIAEFLGVAENGVAVAENLKKELQFYVVLAKKYLGMSDACLVYDRDGKLMKGTELIGGVDVNSKPIITNIAGTNTYLVVCLNSSKVPVYQVIDMDKAGYGTNLAAGEVIAVDQPMTNYKGNAPVHGWHFTAFEDHLNGRSIVYSSRYTADATTPMKGKTEIVAYDFGTDFTTQPQEYILYTLNGCGNTETGELQISPKGDKLLWYQHDKSISGFSHRMANIYTLQLDGDKTSVASSSYAATSTAGNYGKGTAEMMANDEDILYSQRGLYKDPSTGQDRNTWKYYKLTNDQEILNNIGNPLATYLYGEIRRGVDGNYYMPNMGAPADKIHSFSGDHFNSPVDVNEAGKQLASSLPTQVYKLFASAAAQTTIDYNRVVGKKMYELKDHLGNVSVVVNDIKQFVDNGTNANTIDVGDHFVPTVLSIVDYYPFGSEMPRVGGKVPIGYRYGFNGKENDNEVKEEGNQQDYGFRIYDPRLAKFLSVDPLSPKYPELTPYQFASNTPIWMIDVDGLEGAAERTALAIDAKNLHTTPQDVIEQQVGKTNHIGHGIVGTVDGVVYASTTFASALVAGYTYGAGHQVTLPVIGFNNEQGFHTEKAELGEKMTFKNGMRTFGGVMTITSLGAGIWGSEASITLREAYIAEVENLSNLSTKLANAGYSETTIAKTLNKLRRNIGTQYKDMTPPDLLEYIYKFNTKRYGDKLGPTYEYLKSIGKTDAQIIESSSKVLGTQEDLGKALYKMFGDEVKPLLEKYNMLPKAEN